MKQPAWAEQRQLRRLQLLDEFKKLSPTEQADRLDAMGKDLLAKSNAVIENLASRRQGRSS